VWIYSYNSHIKHLEVERKKLLIVDEERWRLKIRAIFKSGDNNTKFFHRFLAIEETSDTSGK
jgi:hypothetical protein